jgi:tape measure domain-containing protein
MAEKEIYHLDIVIGVTGDEDTKKKLSAMDKYVAQVEKRARTLDKINATPAVKINDKATKQMEKINSTVNKLNKAAVAPTIKINDKASEQLEKINGTIGRLNKIKATVTTTISDKISGPVNKIKGGLDKLNSARVFVKTNIIDKVSGPTKIILSGLGKIKNTAWSATVTIKDKISSGLDIIRRGLSKTMAAAVSLQGILLGVGGTWAGIIRPMQISGDFEQTQMAFNTMLKSTQKANSFLSQAQNMANKTPFEFPQLADASKKMLAFGWNVKQILPDLTTIGNAASGLGLGAEGINQITLALGQMKAKGVVQGDEILQLTEAGIPASKILQEQLGLTAEQVGNIGKQGLSADKAVRALLTGMDKRFGGMMQDQAKTALGLMSTLKDTFENKLMNPWGQGLWSGIKPGLTKVTDWLDKNDKKVNELGNLFKKAGQTVSTSIGGALEKSQQRLDKLMDSSQWKSADLGGKITLAWDKIIAEPFSTWWNGPGRPKINAVAESMGSGIGSLIGGGITSLLDALGGKDDKRMGGAGTNAGTAFTNAFLNAFDTGKIIDKLISSFAKANLNMVKEPSADNFAKAGIMDYILYTVGGGALLKGGSKAYKWLRYGNTAGKAAAEATGAGTKAAENVSGISKIANVLKKIGSITNSKVFKALPVIGPLAAFATSAYAVNSSSNKGRTISGLAGNFTGSSIGGKIGGAVGSIFGPIGTGVGYLAGSGIGWYVGGKASTTLYDKHNANSAANKVPTGLTKSLNGVAQSNAKNANTVRYLDKTQSGLILQSNAYRGTLSNLLSTTGLTADSQGRLRDASGQYQGTLGDLLTSTGLVMDSQGNLLDVNSLVQESQANLALSFDDLSYTVGTLNGNMGGLGAQKKESAWDKVKNFFGSGDSKTTSVSRQSVSSSNPNNKPKNDMLSILTGKPTYKANGGITSGPEMSVIGEAGTEAIIPLSSARRNRGLSLWQQAGRMLGVRMFANGGIVGNGPAGGAKAAKATANISTSIALGDDALSQFKQYGNKVNTNLSSGILENRKVSTDSVNKVTDESGSILNLFSKTGHVYGIGMNNDITAGIQSTIPNVTSMVKTLTDKVITEFKNGFGIHSPSRVFYKLAQFIPQGFVNGLTSKDMGGFIKHWIGDISSMAGGAMSGNVSGWLSAALAVTGTPASWLPGLLRLVQAESGGNPLARNSQSVGGEHATGLLQTLPSTFAAYAVKGLDNILNPVANAAAAINYIKARYGSVFNTPLFKGGSYVGYASGTDNAKKGLARINEKGWEFVDFTGGEKVLNHNKSVSLMERAANSLSRVRSAVSNLEIGTTERDIPESSSNPVYYTSQPQMAMAGGYQGDINIDVDNNFNSDADIDDIVIQATKKFATELKKTLQNIKR